MPNETDGYGYIKISRKLFTDKEWREHGHDFSKMEAWIDLIAMARYQCDPGTIMVNHKPVILRRGELFTSLRFLANRWRWSDKKVRIFLDNLCAQNRIKKGQTKDAPRGKQGTHITICKYDIYQGEWQTKDAPRGKRKTQNSNTSIIHKEINIPFDDFWNAYDKKRERPKSEKKWLSLTDEERKAVMDYLPEYKRATPDKQYRKDPTTFLNNRCWEDELIFPGKNQEQLIEFDPNNFIG